MMWQSWRATGLWLHHLNFDVRLANILKLASIILILSICLCIRNRRGKHCVFVTVDEGPE